MANLPPASSTQTRSMGFVVQRIVRKVAWRTRLSSSDSLFSNWIVLRLNNVRTGLLKRTRIVDCPITQLIQIEYWKEHTQGSLLGQESPGKTVACATGDHPKRKLARLHPVVPLENTIQHLKWEQLRSLQYLDLIEGIHNCARVIEY